VKPARSATSTVGRKTSLRVLKPMAGSFWSKALHRSRVADRYMLSRPARVSNKLRLLGRVAAHDQDFIEPAHGEFGAEPFGVFLWKVHRANAGDPCGAMSSVRADTRPNCEHRSATGRGCSPFRWTGTSREERASLRWATRRFAVRAQLRSSSMGHPCLVFTSGLYVGATTA
jgi:hypothetical protein